MMKTDAKIRAKKAPTFIYTQAQAYEAFQRMIEYRRMARNAYTSARAYSAGTHSFYKHLDREELYDAAADEWEAVLATYLRQTATDDKRVA